MSKLISISEFARKSGVNRRSIYRFIESGLLRVTMRSVKVPFLSVDQISKVAKYSKK